MGRKPVIREAILDILKESSEPLHFKQIKTKIAMKLGRTIKKVGDQNININLKHLIAQGQVEKKNFDGKNAYCTTNSYYKTKNKTVLKTILDTADVNNFYPIFEDNNPPLTAYFPNLDQITEYMRKKGDQYFDEIRNRWSEPVDLIMRKMMESFTDLSPRKRRGIAELLAFAYWYGVRERVENRLLFESLEHELKHCKTYSCERLEDARSRGDNVMVDVEKKIIEILDITKKICLVENLSQLFSVFKIDGIKVNVLQSELRVLREVMARGERIFGSFKDFHQCTLDGLEAAQLIPKCIERRNLPQEYRYLLSYSDVWNEIIPNIIDNYNLAETLVKVTKNCDIIKEIKKRDKYLYDLIDLPSKSKMFVFYVWGYKEIFEVSNRDFLPMFANWISNLKAGNLDHSSWIFENTVVLKIINAYKAVKKGKTPENGILDIDEPWTIRDLYFLHPIGKDPTFWRDLLTDINLRLKHMHKNKNLSKHIAAVIDGAY